MILSRHLLPAIAALSVLFADASALEPIRVSKDGKSFVLGESGKPFRVWGVNYDHDTHGEHGRLIEDYWHDEWETVKADFQEIKELGANVIRVHLQLGKFMRAADQPDERELGQLRRLLALAEECGLYLDITGLGCYHKADIPPWYDALEESARWDVQARFWAAVAKVGKESNAVFCYDLMNEPVIGGKTEEAWIGGELGGKFYVQRIAKDLGKRTREEVAKAWIARLTSAIRAEDPGHLVTVGVIPWAQIWPNAKPVFYSPEASGPLDFVSIHLYPKKDEVDKALKTIPVYDIGKPIVIEETFPLSCSLEEMREFIDRSRDSVDGYVSFYWGRTAAEYAAETDPKKQMVAGLMQTWLAFYRENAERLKAP